MADDTIAPDHTQPPVVLSEAAFVDDLMIVIPADNIKNLIANIQKIAAIITDEAAEHGLTINLAPGKTEALIVRSGTGARKAMEDSGGKIKVQTKHCGETELRLTWQYKHLGGLLQDAGDMDPEINRRNGMATAADLRMATKGCTRKCQ